MFFVHRRPPMTDFERRVLAAYGEQARVGYRAPLNPDHNDPPRRSRIVTDRPEGATPVDSEDQGDER